MICMVDLTDDERKIVDAMKSLGTFDEAKAKDAEQICAASPLPKGKVSSLLINLANKKVVKRVARHKSAGYYLMMKDV